MTTEKEWHDYDIEFPTEQGMYEIVYSRYFPQSTGLKAQIGAKGKAYWKGSINGGFDLTCIEAEEPEELGIQQFTIFKFRKLA